MFGIHWGAWQAVLPDLARHYDLSSGPLGLILTIGFAVSLPAMVGAGRLVDRLGAGWAMAIPAAIVGAGVLLIGALPPVPLLVVGVVAMAAGSGSFDVAINGAAMGDAGWSRPARLTLLHAAFSAGGVIGAVGGGALVGSGVPFAVTYQVLAAAMFAAAVFTARSAWPRASTGGSVPRSVALSMLPLAVIAALAFIAEGGMETWSAIYLRDELGAAAFVGALGPAAFHAAMLTGRLIGAGVAGSLGAAPTLVAGAAMGLAGMAVALVVASPAAAIAGMAVAALGLSFVVPVTVSVAAARAGGYAGRAASYVLSLGYAGFLVGPSLIGVLGEMSGLRVALAVIPAAAAIVLVMSPVAAERRTS